MTIAQKIEEFMTRSSWIRKMFEEGARLKSIHGADNVYDFSLGNPNIEPPKTFRKKLKDLVASPVNGTHAYMPNPGYPSVRKAVAAYVSEEQQVKISENEILMTCGAAGGMNVILKTLLDPGDEVIALAPYFVEYGFYVDNHGGKLKTVKTRSDFTLNTGNIQKAITEKVKAVIINSPNNPTGQVYSENSLKELGKMLAEKSIQLGRTIYLISDEPYRKIVYDKITVPGIFPCYPDSIITTSYSKDLSIPGERIGFIAINPEAAYKNLLINGMALANRILGFVNAPALMQRAVEALQGESVDISHYAKKRDLLCSGLDSLGYEFVKPAGAFYLFPKSPISDDVKFVGALQNERILAVPGTGFGCAGHFRLAFCVDDKTITEAMPGFERAIQRF
ncbi:MAG: pyridoxal phosphate-dependent aminotransferase [Desulfobacterales bacterium]|jgi:aspartate aminotransferase|nr:pyridoxal phosphate-dependent aminotransferase [Desulfobacterales bacterium]